MPFVVPTVVGVESLVLDGLDLAQGPNGAIQLDAFTPPIPKKRPEWIEAADSDGALLARDPLVSNGQATIRVGIVGVSRDDAQSIIGQIVDKLEEADRNPLGIPLVWTPADSTPSLTFYVLSGEVTELPVDWDSGYMVNQPSVTFTLDCRPYGYGTPVTYTGAATAGPLVTRDLAAVPGDAPAEATLTVTDMSSQPRRTVEWGAEYRHYNPAAAWSLVLDSDSLVTSGFSGTQTTRTGAYDPGAAGNSIITSTLTAAWQTVCGTGAQPHIGTFRVKARIYTAGTTDLQLRLAWRVGDGSYIRNDPAPVIWGNRFAELDLGLITIPEAQTGTQAWDGIVEGYSDNADAVEVDYLLLFPVEAGYGRARGEYSYSPGVISGYDFFTGITAGTALNARTATAGGTWATSGATTDFVASDLDGGEQESRSTNADSGPRFAILGASTFTNTEVTASFRTALTAGQYMVIGRWTDSSNYLAAMLDTTIVTTPLTLVTVVAGVSTTIALAKPSISPTTWYGLRLTAFDTGRVLATLFSQSGNVVSTVQGVSTALATGGTLASGKPGFADKNASGVAGSIRYYDNFYSAVPAAEPIVLYSGRALQIRHDDTIRESSAGGTWGRPAIYRGSRFKVQPAGDANRTTRVAVKASRNDLDVAEDANLTDQIKLDVTVTPRYTVVPR